jgi:4-amino-4-deoxy-L-arabinose transferase-like glycosyltransferase
MPDTFSFFLFSIGIYLILVNSKNSNYHYILAGLVFGYLTIVKSVFVYLFPFIILFIFYKLYQNNKKFTAKNIASFMIILVMFASIPLSYMYLFNKPRLGTAALENFGGRSGFGNILPFITCEQLYSIMTTDKERDTIYFHCNNTEIHSSNSDDQIWSNHSTMFLMAYLILPDIFDRVAGNQLYQKWLFAVVSKYPTVVFSPIKNTIVNGYLGKIMARQMSIKVLAELHSHCDTFIPAYLNMTLDKYTEGWYLNQQNNKWNIDIIAYMQYRLTKTTDWIIIILFFLFIPLYALYRRVLSSDFVFLYAITLLYLLMISFGSIYDNRYYVIFNYLVLLTTSSILFLKKPTSNNKD